MLDLGGFLGVFHAGNSNMPTLDGHAMLNEPSTGLHSDGGGSISLTENGGSGAEGTGTEDPTYSPASPPFSGSPWVVPAPSHWYANSTGVEMNVSKELAIATPVVCSDNESPEAEVPQVVMATGKGVSIPIGLGSICCKGTEAELKLFEQFATKFFHGDKGQQESKPHAVKPSPGHILLCGNALALGALTAVWNWSGKKLHGEHEEENQLAEDFASVSSDAANAVSPIGGYVLRQHVFAAQESS